MDTLRYFITWWSEINQTLFAWHDRQDKRGGIPRWIRCWARQAWHHQAPLASWVWSHRWNFEKLVVLKRCWKGSFVGSFHAFKHLINFVFFCILLAIHKVFRDLPPRFQITIPMVHHNWVIQVRCDRAIQYDDGDSLVNSFTMWFETRLGEVSQQWPTFAMIFCILYKTVYICILLLLRALMNINHCVLVGWKRSWAEDLGSMGLYALTGHASATSCSGPVPTSLHRFGLFWEGRRWTNFTSLYSNIWIEMSGNGRNKWQKRLVEWYHDWCPKSRFWLMFGIYFMLKLGQAEVVFAAGVLVEHLIDRLGITWWVAREA